MGIIGIIIISVVFSLIVGSIFYFKFYKKIQFERQLKFLYLDIIICPNDFKENFIMEINNFETTNETVVFVEKKVKELQFPIPLTPNSNDTGENIVNKLITLIDKKSLAFVGGEQFILSIFPSEQIGEFTLSALESIGTHTSQAFLETISSIKTSSSAGIANLQNPDMIIEGLKNIEAHFYKDDNWIMHLQILRLQFCENKFNAAVSIFKHSIIDSIKPIFKIDEHILEIKDSWVNHCSEVMSEIGNFDFDFDYDASGNFPFVTLIISTIREFNLLHDDKTFIENSVKNVLLDVAGTGIGAFGGGKFGAAIETLFLPGPGTVIGGTIGGIVGAIAGRFISNNVKHQALKNSLDGYHAEYNLMLSVTQNCAIQSVVQVRSIASSKQKDFINKIVAPCFKNSMSVIINMNQKLMSLIKDDLHDYKQQFTNIKKSKFASKSKYKNIIHDIDSLIDKISDQIPSEYEINNHPIQSFQKIINIQFLRDKKFHRVLSRSFQELSELIKSHRALLLVWGMEVNTLYKQSINEICIELKTQSENYNRKCLAWKQTLKQKEKKVQIEKNKLGL